MAHAAASQRIRIVLITTVLMLLAGLAACQPGRKETQGAPPPPGRQATPTQTTQPGSATTRGDYWPTRDWRTADPSAHGVDAGRLDRMMDYVKANKLDILGVVVVRDGYIVFEQYARGEGPQSRGEVYSVTKSFASTLIGIAQRKGLLTDLDEPVIALLPGKYQNMDARKQAMSLEDVLTMRTGLAWTDDDATIGAFYISPDPVTFMLDLPMAAQPETTFNYCSGCSSLLTAIISKVTGMKAQDFARQELLEPLGITDAYWTLDRNGIALGGWGLSLTAREMAKLGYLFLRGGTWDGQEIVTREWVQAATSKHTTTDNPNGYGYQWWTHPKFPAYMALGRYGQIIYVDPEKDLVLAMRAQTPNHDPIYDLIENYVEPAVR